MLKGQRRSNGVCQVRKFPSIKTFQSLNSWEGHSLARCHCRVCYVHSSEQTVRLGYSLGGEMQWMRILCRIGWWIHFLWVMLTMQLKLQTVVAPHLGELRSQLFSAPPGPPSPVQRESRWGYCSPIHMPTAALREAIHFVRENCGGRLPHYSTRKHRMHRASAWRVVVLGGNPCSD